jgi:hypothetical protein
MAEVWRQVQGWPYEVSDMGRVRRSDTKRVMRGGSINIDCGRDGSRYRMVLLSDAPRTWNVRVHKLVMRAFVGPRPPGYHIDHLNCNRADNRLANLRYIPARENLRRNIIGEDAPAARLTAADVLNIRHLYASGERDGRQLAKDYGVHWTTISLAVRGKTWRHVGGPTPALTTGDDQ